MKNKFYVTTPIYYPNDNLHIGHAYTTTLADYISRYKKLQGYETMFLTGSDEHGQKIADRALEQKKDPLEFVTEIIKNFKKLWKDLDIDYDVFIRTTDHKHKEYVKESFTQLLDKKFIYKSKYTGLYCKSDEAYFTNTQAKDNKCPECGNELKLLSEESYFLKISEFKDWIKDKLLEGNILIPSHRVKELINNFVNELQDLSVTRTSFDWGIKLNEDQKHVIYVWLDALQNYISALNYKESKFTVDEVWSKDSNVELLQLVGKEITRFHCIYWPIILEMKNMRQPRVMAHGWLVTDEGNKMSKSKGNVINPIELIDKYGSDSLRFFLINNIVTGEDGKFSEKLLVDTINGLLVNKFSNLVARTDSMVKKYFNGIVPDAGNDIKQTVELKEKLILLKKQFISEMDSYKFSDSTKTLIKYIENINLYIDLTEPWKSNGDELKNILNTLVNEIFNITTLLSPILTKSYKKIFNWLNHKDEPSISLMSKDFSNTKLNDVEHIFQRIDTVIGYG